VLRSPIVATCRQPGRRRSRGSLTLAHKTLIAAERRLRAPMHLSVAAPVSLLSQSSKSSATSIRFQRRPHDCQLMERGAKPVAPLADNPVRYPRRREKAKRVMHRKSETELPQLARDCVSGNSSMISRARVRARVVRPVARTNKPGAPGIMRRPTCRVLCGRPRWNYSPCRPAAVRNEAAKCLCRHLGVSQEAPLWVQNLPSPRPNNSCE
jgi:hypothetical protein